MRYIGAIQRKPLRLLLHRGHAEEFTTTPGTPSTDHKIPCNPTPARLGISFPSALPAHPSFTYKNPRLEPIQDFQRFWSGKEGNYLIASRLYFSRKHAILHTQNGRPHSDRGRHRRGCRRLHDPDSRAGALLDPHLRAGRRRRPQRVRLVLQKREVVAGVAGLEGLHGGVDLVDPVARVVAPAFEGRQRPSDADGCAQAITEQRPKFSLIFLHVRRKRGGQRVVTASMLS
jgi:hypothetical protein